MTQALTHQDQQDIDLELAVLETELTGLQWVEPVSPEAVRKLVQTRDRIIGEMRRLQRLLRT